MDTTTATINTFFQLSIPTDHNGIINKFPTCHIFHPSKINLDGSHKSGLIKFSPRNQLIKCANIFRKSVHAEIGQLDQ